MPNYDKRFFDERTAEDYMGHRDYRPGKMLKNTGGFTYWDTNDPYILIREAKQAKELLDKGYIKSALASTDAQGDGQWSSPEGGWNHAECVDPIDIRATGFCAMGAVMAIQGHQVEACGLIRRLDIAAYHRKGEGEYAPKATDESACMNVRAYHVNDQESKSETMALFNMTINTLQAEIDLAEAWAADEYKDHPTPHSALMDWLYAKPTNDNPWVQRVLDRFYAKESE